MIKSEYLKLAAAIIGFLSFIGLVALSVFGNIAINPFLCLEGMGLGVMMWIIAIGLAENEKMK